MDTILGQTDARMKAIFYPPTPTSDENKLKLIK